VVLNQAMSATSRRGTFLSTGTILRLPNLLNSVNASLGLYLVKNCYHLVFSKHCTVGCKNIFFLICIKGDVISSTREDSHSMTDEVNRKHEIT
jgi:hypothetical protein